MASPAYERILEIQALDLSIDQLRHRAATHPARATIEELEQRLAQEAAATAEVEEGRHQLERQQKRLQDEVAMLTARRTEIDGKLYGGEITASKELLALQDEAAGLQEKQTGLEDEELEIMEQLETVGSTLEARGAVHAEVEQQQAAARAELEAAVAEIEAEISTVSAQRAERVAPPESEAPAGWGPLLAQYDSLRPQYDGVPVARLSDGRCDGCHMQLSAVAVDQLSKMPDDAVVTCEECGRLLVR